MQHESVLLSGIQSELLRRGFAALTMTVLHPVSMNGTFPPVLQKRRTGEERVSGCTWTFSPWCVIAAASVEHLSAGSESHSALWAGRGGWS